MLSWQDKVYNITQHAVTIIVNKKVKGKILTKRINVHIKHIKHSRSRGKFSFLCVKENERKKKEANGKGTWFKLKHQPTLSNPWQKLIAGTNYL